MWALGFHFVIELYRRSLNALVENLIDKEESRNSYDCNVISHVRQSKANGPDVISLFMTRLK